MTARLVALYEKGDITADHLIVESLRLLDPANPGLVLEALPNEVLPRVLKYAQEYRPGKMRTNYGVQPTPDQVAAARKWIEASAESVGRHSHEAGVGQITQVSSEAGHRLTGLPGKDRVMPNTDPWLTAPVGRKSTSRKRVARLAGKEPGSDKVHVLIKLHDRAGRAIYVYNLVTGERRHIPHPSEEIWEQYSHLGVEVPHPGDIQATDTTRWVAYGKQEAERRGLKVEV
jgi:hypothetical protein